MTTYPITAEELCGAMNALADHFPNANVTVNVDGNEYIISSSVAIKQNGEIMLVAMS